MVELDGHVGHDTGVVERGTIDFECLADFGLEAVLETSHQDSLVPVEVGGELEELRGIGCDGLRLA